MRVLASRAKILEMRPIEDHPLQTPMQMVKQQPVQSVSRREPIVPVTTTIESFEAGCMQNLGDRLTALEEGLSQN